jgi:predicted transcriptional regulator
MKHTIYHTLEKDGRSAASLFQLNVLAFMTRKFREQEAIGLTQSEVARRMGISRQRVSQILGSCSWDMATVARFIHAVCGEEIMVCTRDYATDIASGRKP